MCFIVHLFLSGIAIDAKAINSYTCTYTNPQQPEYIILIVDICNHYICSHRNRFLNPACSAGASLVFTVFLTCHKKLLLSQLFTSSL